MTVQVEKLEFDGTMSNPDNFIKNEQHMASERVIVPRYGSFYRNAFKPIQAGRELILGTDYKFAIYNQEANLATGQAVHAAIVLLTTSGAPVILNYHAVGGKFCSYTGVIVDMINELNLIDDIIRASDIVGLPEVFPPAPHLTHGDDLVGLERLVEILARIQDAIFTGNPATMQRMREELDAKVNTQGVIRLNPTSGYKRLYSNPGTVTRHDLVIPRAETPNSFVVVELMILGDEGISNVTIAYKEVPSGIAEVSHCRLGTPASTQAEFGVAKGNGNTTIIRFQNAATVKVFSEVYVKSISSVSDDLIYDAVAWLPTPSVVAVTLRPLN